MATWRLCNWETQIAYHTPSKLLSPSLQVQLWPRNGQCCQTCRLLRKSADFFASLRISLQNCKCWKFSTQVCGFFIFAEFLRIFDNFERIFLVTFVKLSPHARVARWQTNSATYWKERKNFGKYLFYILPNLPGNDIPKNTPFWKKF